MPTVLDVGTDARPAGSEAVVEDAVRRGETVTDCVWLTGGDDRSSLLTRLEVAERLRRRNATRSWSSRGPTSCAADLADGLAADRAHLVAVRGERSDGRGPGRAQRRERRATQ